MEKTNTDSVINMNNSIGTFNVTENDQSTVNIQSCHCSTTNNDRLVKKITMEKKNKCF
jgi:hypothetical protein